MYLFFDTETTGLPKSYKAPITNLKNWPRMIQIAWILSDFEQNRIESNSFIIRPENFTIPHQASKVHGITTKRAIQEGAELKDVLSAFNRSDGQADVIVANNICFDERIIGAELLRKNIKSDLDQKTKLCTMHAATQFCKISGPYGYKWPKLSELHIKLFKRDFEDAHNASADIDATERCFWEMKKIGLITI